MPTAHLLDGACAQCIAVTAGVVVASSMMCFAAALKCHHVLLQTNNYLEMMDQVLTCCSGNVTIIRCRT